MSERQTAGGTGQAPKRPYVAPVVEKVALRAEEAVLGFCKNSSIRGPRGGNCRAVGVCSTQGS